MTTATRRGLLVAIGAVVLFAAAFVAGKSTAGADEVPAQSGTKSIEVQADPVEPIELQSTGPLPKLRPAPEADSGDSPPVGPTEPTQPDEPTQPTDPTPPAPPPDDPPPDNGGDDFF